MDLVTWMPGRPEGKNPTAEYVFHWVCGMATAAHHVVPLFISETNEVPDGSTGNLH
jgi:hypothetical protein